LKLTRFRYGGVNVLLPLSVACIVVLCLIPLAQTFSALVGISIAYGFLSGGVIIIPGPTITDLAPSDNQIGVRLGLAYLVAAFGGLVGNPISGAVKGTGKDAVQNFSGVWWCAAGIMGLGVVALVATRWLKLGSPLVAGRV
jgi:MFS family permease